MRVLTIIHHKRPSWNVENTASPHFSNTLWKYLQAAVVPKIRTVNMTLSMVGAGVRRHV